MKGLGLCVVGGLVGIGMYCLSGMSGPSGLAEK